MLRRRAKKDDNHNDVADVFTACGFGVIDLSALGDGIPDMLVGNVRGNWLVEVKDGAKSPSRRRLTPDQVKRFGSWPNEVYVVKDGTQALELACALRYWSPAELLATHRADAKVLGDLIG